jgi:hypothetical protein
MGIWGPSSACPDCPYWRILVSVALNSTVYLDLDLKCSQQIQCTHVGPTSYARAEAVTEMATAFIYHLGSMPPNGKHIGLAL